LATKRIGFACKWIDTPDQVNGIKSTDPAKELNTGTTTVAWLNRQTREVAEQRLWDLMVQNITSTQKLVERVGTLDESLRMVRLSSDILPVYTESSWSYFWRRTDVRDFCSTAFAQVGDVEEMKHGLDTCLELYDLVPIVLDIHHHFIREGEYIQLADARTQKVLESWRGIRPTCHYSVSREDILVGHASDSLPDMKVLLESGHKKSKLRAHSDFYWNTAVNDWALTFLDSFDMMCESKAKNLASFALHARAKQIGIL